MDLSESIAPAHQKALQVVCSYLERPDFVARLAEYVGRPVDRIFSVTPRRVNARLNKIVETTILSCLKLAIGLVASERVAASALPVAGALGGATVNFLFTNHFQRIAHGHFTIRRLERHYGKEIIRGDYQSLNGRPSEKEKTRI